VYMPLMVNLRMVVVLGGERGEGLQKVQKFAVFADRLIVVPEAPYPHDEIVLPAGPQDLLREDLQLPEERRVPVTHEPASSQSIARYCRGATLVCSDLNDRKLNETARSFCEEQNILCNIIDTKDLCNTWLMSLIDTPDFQVALTTKGRCAYYAAKAREELSPVVNKMGRWATVLASLRSLVPQGRSKMATLDEVYHDPEFCKAMNRSDFDAALAAGEEIIYHA
jgi:siroheme synthase (precorrin-2 oxidase/ferrochelatase)